MQLDELRTFLALAEIKNFTKTAEKLLMSQPTVSLHIKNLEKEFQTELFQRSPKFLKITQSGELLLDRAKKIIAVYEQTRQDISELQRTIKGKIKIGASFTIGEYILPSLLRDLNEQYNELELEITIGNTREIVDLIKQSSIDVGLIEGQAADKEILVVPFMEDELFIISSNDHPLAALPVVSLPDLQDQSWITRENGSETGDFLKSILRTNSLKVNSILTISSNQGIKEAVINGLGLSLLSKSVISRDMEHHYLKTIKLHNLTFKRTFSYIFTPLLKEKRNVKAFIAVLEDKWIKPL